jgi:hypothetical protein
LGPITLAEPALLVNCFACGKPRPTEQIENCPRCGVPICGMSECSAMCLCDVPHDTLDSHKLRYITEHIKALHNAGYSALIKNKNGVYVATSSDVKEQYGGDVVGKTVIEVLGDNRYTREIDLHNRHLMKHGYGAHEWIYELPCSPGSTHLQTFYGSFQVFEVQIEKFLLISRLDLSDQEKALAQPC